MQSTLYGLMEICEIKIIFSTEHRVIVHNYTIIIHKMIIQYALGMRITTLE